MILDIQRRNVKDVSEAINKDPDNINLLLDLILDNDGFSIGPEPNQMWLGSNPSVRTISDKMTKLNGSKVDDNGNRIKVPGQPDHGFRWWCEVKFKYRYNTGDGFVNSIFPAIKVCGCIINLKQRPVRSNSVHYGVEFVEVGLPLQVAYNLIVSLNNMKSTNCIIADSKFSVEDGCYWFNCSTKVKEGEERNKLYMVLSEEIPEELQEGVNDADAEEEKEHFRMRKAFNADHKCCEDVINSPHVSAFYNCDLLLEVYGSVVIAEGCNPSDIANIELPVKFKVKVVHIISSASETVGNIPCKITSNYNSSVGKRSTSNAFKKGLSTTTRKKVVYRKNLINVLGNRHPWLFSLFFHLLIEYVCID